MRIPLLSGRLLTASDRQGTLIPAVINETLARYYWPRGNPLGSGFRMEPDRQNHYTIVGVVADVRNKLLSDPPAPEMYLGYTEFSPEHLSWAIRSHLNPVVLSSELRQAIASVDPDRALFNTRPMQGVLERSLSRARLIAIMVSFFASAAILLSILGVFGVVSYGVRQRTGEIGTRMALGAAPRDMLRLFLTEGVKMLAYGLVIGLVLVLIVTRTSPSDELKNASYVLPFLIAALLIAALTLAACWFPAWRATTLSPLVAIRSDLHPSWARIPLRYRELGEHFNQTLSQATAHHRATPSAISNELLAAIVDSSRQAESFAGAMQAALETLCREMNSTAAYLFERKSPENELILTCGAPAHKAGKLPAQAILIKRLYNYSSALPTGPDDLEVAHRWAAEHALHHVPEIETLQRLDAHLAAPVLAKKTIIGVLLLAAPAGRASYLPEEARALRAAAAQLALLIENGRMMDRIVEQEYLRRELALASDVQKRLFPQEAFEDASIQLTGMCLPARGVGGDYYDFLDLGSGQIGVALADVAGKGIAAALLMSIVQASLRSIAGHNGASLADLASRVNRLLHGSTGVSSYATFFYAQVDGRERIMRYVNAGHNPPFLLCRDCLQELSTGGMVIGMFAHAEYEEGSIELHSGDVLLLFTDGVSEAHDPDEQEFGEARLKDLLRRTAQLPLLEMSAAVLGELKAWMQDAPQHDDLTFVLMKVR
jgi:serine phosphatase RsbU (regulator of sigma subunit)